MHQQVNMFTLHTNDKGGKAYFVPVPNSANIKNILDETGISWDVRFEKSFDVTGGNLSYIHKRVNGQDIYFFANSSDNYVDVPVVLKGKLKLQLWNPQNGEISGCETKTESKDGIDYTRIQLKLNPVESVFFVSQ